MHKTLDILTQQIEFVYYRLLYKQSLLVLPHHRRYKVRNLIGSLGILLRPFFLLVVLLLL